MKVMLMAAAALMVASGGARADQMFAIQFGGLIASEQACDLAFDEAAIVRVIDKNVPADDIQFATYFEAGIGTAKRRIAEMSGSALIAHCAQVRRVAGHLELLSN